jgi:hypothetical protein
MRGQSGALRHAVKQMYKGEVSAVCDKPSDNFVEANLTYESRGSHEQRIRS